MLRGLGGDYLQVPLRPIKGLKIDNRDIISGKGRHAFHGATHPPLAKNVHKISRQEIRSLSVKPWLAEDIHPRRNSIFCQLEI